MVLILQGLSGFGVTLRKTSLVTDMVVQG
jgi:hypothetical protein